MNIIHIAIEILYVLSVGGNLMFEGSGCWSIRNTDLVCLSNEMSTRFSHFITIPVLFALQVHPDLSRQLLQDGYRLDEIPDDEDLDLIPPKAMGSSVCCCSEGPSCSTQWCWGQDSTHTKAQLQLLSLTLVAGAWGLLSNPALLLCCLWTSSSEAKLLSMQDCLHRDRSTHMKNTDGHKNKPYPLWPQSLTYFFIFPFIELYEMLSMPLLQKEWQGN